MKHTLNIGSWLMVILLSCLSTANASEIAIIVNANHAIKSASLDEVKRLYLGKTSTISAVKLIPVDQPEARAIRTLFYDKVCQKTPNQAKSYWAQLIFTGGGSPPPVLEGDDEVISWVTKTDNAIGYIDAKMLNDKVKSILTIPVN